MNIDIPGPFSPDPGVEISVNGRLAGNVGVCVKPTCPCPKKLPLIKTSIDFKTYDFGEIEWEELEKILQKKK